MIVVKKDNKNLEVLGSQAESILQAYKDPKRQNDVIDIKGMTFRVKDIKEIIDDKFYDNNELQERRRLYLENINAKRKIPEWQDLETQQYQLLKDKQMCLGKSDYESSADIQNILVSNSEKMKAIARQHNLWKPELNTNYN